MADRFLHIVCALAILLMAGCEKEEDAISLSTPGTTELYSVTNQTNEIKFRTEDTWTANCTADWLTFSPKSGQAGENTITLATTSTNRTKRNRTTVLTIQSGGKTKTVNIKQRNEYAYFESDELNLGSQSTTVGVRFWTNLEQAQLDLYASEGLDDWITFGDGSSARTRAEYEGFIYPLHIAYNSDKNPREGALILTMKDNKGSILGLDTLFIYQEGSDNGYHSHDYSQDGKVELLNKATEGKGIPIVLMGDGFVDEEIADSLYARTMNQAMENLFSEEPVRSLRSYFNVYQVTAVSDRNYFDGVSTAFGTVPDHQTTGIDVNADAVMRYVKKVEGIDSIHALAVVILNTSQNKGVTYIMRDDKKTDYEYAIALCPVIDNLKSEMFRLVLTHEAIGHGFAKLADEYVRSTEGSATDEDILLLKQLHEKWSWFMNVDSEKDSTKVIWSQFIFDDAFANEKIGTYEGGYTFFKGVYRPSEGSMMNLNDSPFNAPSRQAIYNKVMLLGLGKRPTYEEFVEFDKQHKPSKWSYRTRARGTWEALWYPAPPKIIRH
ncbi:MAG: hypothetical protein IJ868_03225 [Prevotella sp.]|nr:hypothetical protein [Prevotella sp.]